MRKRLLLCSALFAVPMMGADVNVAPPTLRILSQASVRATCKSAADTACTTFNNTEMSCLCDFAHGRWAPFVTISAKPSIVASHTVYLTHEIGHVFDFDQSMQRFADTVEDHAFKTRSLCERFALEAERVFPQILRDYKVASMFLRDRTSFDGK